MSNLQHKKAIHTSSFWYFQLLTYILNMGLAIKQQIALFVPSDTSIFAFFTEKTVALFNWLSIGAVVLGWGRFFKQIYDFWNQPKDKAYWSNLFIAFVSNTAMTTFMILTAVGVATGGALFINLALCYAPYILAAAIGINTLYCLGKAIYYAYLSNQENDVAVKSQHHWDCLKQIFAIVVNALALIVTINLGILFGAASTKLLAGDFTALTDMVALYTNSQVLIWSFIGTVAAAFTLNIYKSTDKAVVPVTKEKLTSKMPSPAETSSPQTLDWNKQHCVVTPSANHAALSHKANPQSDGLSQIQQPSEATFSHG